MGHITLVIGSEISTTSSETSNSSESDSEIAIAPVTAPKGKAND